MSTNSVEWPLWSTTARIVVTDPSTLSAARAIADGILDDIDRACSRFRSDSELNRALTNRPGGVTVSETLAMLVARSLEAAEATDGDVDPALGYAMDAVGYDRDIRFVEENDLPIRAVVSRRPGWKSVDLRGRELRLPAHLSLDLGATAKAVAADLVATAIVAELGGGALVSLGGDIATCGIEPAGGWNILVQDLPADPACTVRLTAGAGMATSSTQKRTWMRAGEHVHHILDPRTGLPAEPVWRSVTVSANSCLHANALATASIVRGGRAVGWLESLGASARLVASDGTVTTVGGWPV
jgi:thiamine biosynthesis lipoprotein